MSPEMQHTRRFFASNDFSSLSNVELDALACKVASRVDHLKFHARNSHKNRTELTRLEKRLAALDAEVNKRHA